MVSISEEGLPNICLKVVTSKESLSALYEAVLKHPRLLILEDFIGFSGKKRGFKDEVIEEARERSKILNQAANRQRYGNV